MSSDSEPGSGGRLLEWWSSGEEGVLQFGSAADSCKKVGSGRPSTRPLRRSSRLYDHPVYPACYLRRVDHVDESAVRGYDDLAVRLAFVISG
ncbi:hypothetical protein BHM03_00012783 [Ensete ventricosum]|nr:hypothetical protein BHM03_00012783 [Ensete ventricosum]